MAKPGPETKLTKKLILEIRKLILRGKKYAAIRKDLGISEGTWDTWYWKNYKELRTICTEARRERIVDKAEANLSNSLDSKDERIKTDMTKYALDRLAKDKGYTTRKELTGKDGEKLNDVQTMSDEELIKLIKKNE